MSDTLPTIWKADPHTIAKHQILETYLKAWMPIMSRQSQSPNRLENGLLFVDGFAGPGVYEDGKYGSPILALKSAWEHVAEFPIPVRFLFIEDDHKRFSVLQNTINQYQSQIDNSPNIKNVKAKKGDCETILTLGLDAYKKKRQPIGPALFFLDQFGYSDVSMKLIRRIMKQPLCEVFTYLNWEGINRFFSDQQKWDSITHAFGGEEWKEVFKLLDNKKMDFMRTAYINALKVRANAKYVWNFAMCDKNDKLIYWLFFCTNNLRGLEEMKKAMQRVDSTGGFRFSDRDNPEQLNLFEYYNTEQLCQDLIARLRGQTLTLFEIKEFVLTETPAVLFKSALKLLEEKSLLQITGTKPSRRKGTFPDDQAHQIQIKFQPAQIKL